MLADQVWSARAALAVYAATHDARYLDFARSLCDRTTGTYEDREHWMGLWERPDARPAAQASSEDQPRQLTAGVLPMKPVDDGLAISANAAAAMLGVELYEATKQPAYLAFARRTVYAFGRSVGEGDPQRTGLALAMCRFLAVAGSVGH